jgi:ammonia channel protein AmtB
MLALINLFVKVRVTAEYEIAGLDFALHGERAYDEGSL